MVLQIMGKVRVALSPKEPEWAHVALYVSARGHHHRSGARRSSGLFEVEADLLAPRGRRADVGGRSRRRVALRDRPVAEFWSEFVAALRTVGIDAELSPDAAGGARPDPVPRRHDAPHVRRRGGGAVLAGAGDVSSRCSRSTAPRSRGKVSRVQFFWGSADLAVTRFSGEPCTPPAGAGLLDAGRTTTSR